MKNTFFHKLKNSLALFLGSIFLATSLLAIVPTASVYADPVTTDTTTSETTETDTTEVPAVETVNNSTEAATSCNHEVGSGAWIVCSLTNTFTKAMDYLYGLISDFLVFTPINKNENFNTVTIIWKYCRSITNFVFIIFILIIVLSQVTGLGLSNYNIKRTLPRIIIAAVMVNLSFIICEIAIDLSNIIGVSLTGVFESVKQAAIASGAGSEINISAAGIYGALATGTTGAALGVAIAISTGAIWLLLSMILPAVISVFSAFIAIALRTAAIYILVMISPLAFVCYLLPNTEKWFQKWKSLLTRMLVFFPLFALLFGACDLAGWAIASSATNISFVILGLGVQTVPLFYSWKLLQTSGTFFSSVRGTLSRFAKPLQNSIDRTAKSKAALANSRHLANPNSTIDKARSWSSKRRADEAMMMKKYEDLRHANETAYHESKNYKHGDIDHGTATRRTLENATIASATLKQAAYIQRAKNDAEMGYSDLPQNDPKNASLSKSERNRAIALGKIENELVKYSDERRSAEAEGKRIQTQNTINYANRMQAALEAKSLEEENARIAADPDAKHRLQHLQPDAEALARARRLESITRGNTGAEAFITGSAVSQRESEQNFIESKFSSLFRSGTITTNQLDLIASEIIQSDDPQAFSVMLSSSSELNRRGDQDNARKIITNYLKTHHVKYGSLESQRLANHCLTLGANNYELKRFAKHINKENAQFANGNRPESCNTLLYANYVDGEFHDQSGRLIRDEFGNTIKTKNSRPELMKGTPLNGDRETPLLGDHSVRETIIDENGPITAGADNMATIEKICQQKKDFNTQTIAASISDISKMQTDSEELIAICSSRFGSKQDGSRDQGLFSDEEYKNMSAAEKAKADEPYEEAIRDFFKNSTSTNLIHLKSNALKAAYITIERKRKREGKPSDEDSIYAEIRSYIPEEYIQGARKAIQRGYSGDAKTNIYKLLGIPKPQKKSNDPQTKTRQTAPQTQEPEPAFGTPNPSIQLALEDITNAFETLPPRNQSDKSETEQIATFYDEIHRTLTHNIPGVSSIIRDLDTEFNSGHFTTIQELYDYITDQLSDLL